MTKLRENLEIKARVLDAEGVRDAARRISTSYLGVMRQRDTYFESREGRLKLREIHWEECGDQAAETLPADSAELIWYLRANTECTTPSRYRIMKVDDPGSMVMALENAIGTRDIVCKRREVYLHKNVRIHLDEVEELGHFIELEAVQGGQGDDIEGWEDDLTPGVQLGLLDWMMDRLEIARDQLMATSYIDMKLST